MKRRVVITGMSMITPIGNDWKTVELNLRNKKSGIKYMAEWEKYQGLNTKLAAPAHEFNLPENFSRKKTRSMGRVAILATYCANLALQDSNLLENPIIKNGLTGVAYGSSSGSVDAIMDFYSLMRENVVNGLTATTYIKMMGHTCPVNISLFFETTGRIIPTGTACTSGSMAIGYAFEAIKNGYQDVMIAGGAEELSPTQAAVFDTLYATSIKNKEPHLTPRPFDKNRDGLVIGEGAGTLILEELEHAKARNAKIYGEIVGFATNNDGAHVTQPNKDTMQKVLEMSLKDANLKAGDIGYINAHGTSTDHGDIAESHATFAVFGNKTPISTQKGYMGHTLGACGAIEAILTIEMMNRNWYAPNVNLDNIDERCADLDYITGNGREMNIHYAMSNNFAFGGINTSLIFKRFL